MSGDNSFIDKKYGDSAYFGKIGESDPCWSVRDRHKVDCLRLKAARSADGSFFDEGIILAEGYRTSPSGIAARLTMSNKVDANAFGSIWSGMVSPETLLTSSSLTI